MSRLVFSYVTFLAQYIASEFDIDKIDQIQLPLIVAMSAVIGLLLSVEFPSFSASQIVGTCAKVFAGPRKNND